MTRAAPPPPEWDRLITFPERLSFRAEDIAFELGLKQVLRLEDLPASEAEAMLGAWRDKGFRTLLSERRYTRTGGGPNWEQSGGPREYTYGFAGSSDRTLSRAMELDAEEKASGKERSQAQRDAATMGLGVLLGYPQCCTDAFLELPNRGDNRSWPALIANRSKGTFPFFLNNLQYADTLMTFFPCGYDCPVAAGTVAPVWRAVKERSPSYAAALEDAMRVVVLYAGWERFALLHGRVTGPGEVEYCEVRHPGNYRPHLLDEPGYREFILPLVTALNDGSFLRVESDGLAIFAQGSLQSRYGPSPGDEAGRIWRLLDFTGAEPREK